MGRSPPAVAFPAPTFAALNLECRHRAGPLRRFVTCLGALPWAPVVPDKHVITTIMESLLFPVRGTGP